MATSRPGSAARSSPCSCAIRPSGWPLEVGERIRAAVGALDLRIDRACRPCQRLGGRRDRARPRGPDRRGRGRRRPGAVPGEAGRPRPGRRRLTTRRGDRVITVLTDPTGGRTARASCTLGRWPPATSRIDACPAARLALRRDHGASSAARRDRAAAAPDPGRPGGQSCGGGPADDDPGRSAWASSPRSARSSPPGSGRGSPSPACVATIVVLGLARAALPGDGRGPRRDRSDWASRWAPRAR